MKIAFINIYQGKVERGAETYVSELAKRLSRNHNVALIEGRRTPPQRWPIIWRLFIDPQGIIILLWTLSKLPYILKNKFDIIITLNGGWQAALIRITTWIYGGKLVISGQSGIGFDDINNLWCFPDIFVAASTYGQKWAKKVNPFVRTVKIPNGVDINKFRPDGDKITLNLKKPIILSVGALTSIKRHDLTIKAMSKLKKGSLLIIGKGELKKNLTNQARKLIPGRFKIMDYPNAEIDKVYRSADIFVYPTSEYESFGIAMLEAMASGLPVVAGNDPIRKEIIQDSGLAVDCTNSFDYSQAISKALKTDWGSKPRKQAEKFSWEKIAKEYEELLRNL
jgi:glycosyltransferase involved in cell wall biosynthesis